MTKRSIGEMSVSRNRLFLVSVAALVLLAALPVAAQQNDPSLAAGPVAAPQSQGTSEQGEQDFGAFGLNTQDFWVSATQFTARNNSGAAPWKYNAFLYFSNPNAGTQQYEAQILLPAGAVMTILECWFNSATANTASVGMWKQSVTYSTGGSPPGNTNITTVTSTPSGGYHAPFQSINETIKFRDADNRNIYTLLASMPADTGVSLRGCRIFWNRSISPAPASASFTDVPTSYWAFQHIEALRASGITQGVTPTTYEPESNVTRAQMAVFLAKALGLHWPW